MRKGYPGMVKGVARRVVVVKAPESPLFEQAIFILRDDIEAQRGVDADAILREACNTAGEYVRKHTKKNKRRFARIPAPAFAAAGAAITGVAWLMTMIR